MANPEPAMAEGSPEGYDRVELELAILLRRAHAGSGDLSPAVHPGLQATAYPLLARLHELGSARAADLSDYFGIDKGSLSRQLKLLEGLELITREPDTADRRSHQLSLTARGSRRLTQARRARRRLIRSELSRWPASDVETFGELLARFNTLNQDQS
jgi:DNA-binding MarR family transcriptional regulator